MPFLSAVVVVILTISGSGYVRPRPLAPPRPTQVWVDAAEGLESLTGLATGLYNDASRTKFTCARSADDDSACQPAPCPTNSMCLAVRWGQFTDDTLDARISPTVCAGGCYRAGLIEINPEGPMYTQIGSWTPYHRLRLVARYFGFFTGLPAQQGCVSWMSPITCVRDGFTPAEAEHLRTW